MENKQMQATETEVQEIFETLREKKRDNSVITEPEKIVYIIKEYIGNKDNYLINSFPLVSFKITSYETNGEVLLSSSSPYKVEGEFTTYVTFKKHIELKCEFIENVDGKIKARIIEARIAKEGRKTKRVNVKDHEVFGNRFLISKNKIDLNPLSYSVSNRVIFGDVERAIGEKYPGIKILDMDPMNDTLEKKFLKKYNQGWLVEDVHEPEAYSPSEPDMLNLSSTPGFEVAKTVQKFKSGGTKSWICRPLRYTNIAGQNFPIGYFVIKSNDRHYTLEDYQNLEEEENKIIERIKDANTVLVDVKEQVQNIGANGVLLEVSDREFQDYVLNRTDLSFDLLFKYQPGLRYYTQITHIKRKANDKLLVGMSFHGVVYSGSGGSKNKKILQDSLSYLVKQGAPVI
ncbi:MAG: DUF1577 domain-containing protein [Leptospirales bacterium]